MVKKLTEQEQHDWLMKYLQKNGRQGYKDWENSVITILKARLSTKERMEDYLDLNNLDDIAELMLSFQTGGSPERVVEALLA
jgi:hypothetical protein